jgi:hypothetical protein
MPASFVCGQCGFQLEKRSISAVTGAVGIRKGGEDGDVCPNDGQPLRRKMWKEAFEECTESSHEVMLALIESVKLQSHYADLLNMHDGGTRMQFSCAADWIQRLKATGTIQ